jgi:hypothetical protein
MPSWGADPLAAVPLVPLTVAVPSSFPYASYARTRATKAPASLAWIWVMTPRTGFVKATSIHPSGVGLVVTVLRRKSHGVKSPVKSEDAHEPCLWTLNVAAPGLSNQSAVPPLDVTLLGAAMVEPGTPLALQST